jgi:hypothetical protein
MDEYILHVASGEIDRYLWKDFPIIAIWQLEDDHGNSTKIKFSIS